MSRWKASAIHFSISVAVFVTLLSIILALWYPGILFSVGGGLTGLRIVMGVDLVLGPLLTLVVFKSGKPGLRFDLTCIGLAQVACMTAGMWIVYSERPIAVVLAYDTIYSLAAEDFKLQGKDPAVVNAFPGRSPKMLYVELPENDVSADIANVRSQFIGDPLYMQTDKYRQIPTAAKDLSTVFRRAQFVRNGLGQEARAQLPATCLLSKFLSAEASGFVCYDTASARLSQFIASDPVADAADSTAAGHG